MEYTFKPVGLIESCFKFKNGTPRQPSVCGQARASLTINTEVYSNPDQSLMGLEEFSHVWVIFVFHQNNNAYKKAKVKPPRLNGAKVGVFSTRSPYRLNNIGLTLAKIEGIEGATLHLSGIDMLDGTPVLDIKPYIPLYDKPLSLPLPDNQPGPLTEASELSTETPEFATDCGAVAVATVTEKAVVNTCDEDTGDVKRTAGRGGDSDLHSAPLSQATGGQSMPSEKVRQNKAKKKLKDKGKTKTSERETNDVNVLDVASGLYISKDTPEATPYATGQHFNPILPDAEATKDGILTDTSVTDGKDDVTVSQGDIREGQSDVMAKQVAQTPPKQDPIKNEAEYACWIKEPPYQKLTVRFTQTARDQLDKFSTTANEDEYRLKYIKSAEEARIAITNILEADPRSSYRRQKCVDRLYFFMVDVLHATCWFNDDENVAEVVRIKPNREKMMQKLTGQK